MKNKVFRTKKRHFLTFFAIYSKRDFCVTAFFQSLITPQIMRLPIKSFREMKSKEFGQIVMKPNFEFLIDFFSKGGFTFFAKILGETPPPKIGPKFQNSGFIFICPNSLAFTSRKDFVKKCIFGGVIRIFKNMVMRKLRFE